MSLLARSVLRTVAPTFTRASSSATQAFQTPSQSATDTPTPSSSTSPSSPESSKRFLPNASHLIPASMSETDPDKWWKATELAQATGTPGNNFSGRSMHVRPNGYATAYNQLRRSLMLSGLIRDVKRSERHEKPSQKKQRLQSERHRRRFQEEIRKRVALVMMTQGRK